MMNEEIYFRSYKFGALMTESKGSVCTETQLAKIKELESERDTGLNKNGNKVKWEGTTKPSDLEDLIKKRDSPPELSETAKSFVEEIWLLNNKGFWDELDSKYLTKGLLNEQDGLGMLTELYPEEFFFKNQERKYKGNITGEADVIYERDGKRIVLDIKCSWNPKSFMNGNLSKIYEYQLRCYMMLYEAEEAQLCYCLTDTPEHLVAAEKKKQWWKYYHEGMTEEEQAEMEELLIPIYEQIDRNLIFSTSDRYTLEERVKIYTITRDLEIEKAMLAKIKPALEYYKSIKLNQI